MLLYKTRGVAFGVLAWVVLAAGALHGGEVPLKGCGTGGEILYNGIVLPRKWPPNMIDPRDTEPMAVPYLACPPKVIPIDVGRQLFVDDFLVTTSTLKRVFHLPVKYAGNPILKPETALELNGEKNAAAVPKSGGVWWDPAEKIAEADRTHKLRFPAGAGYGEVG